MYINKSINTNDDNINEIMQYYIELKQKSLQIKYYTIDLERKTLFDTQYKTLCKDEDFQGFINIGLYGRINNKLFTIYKSSTNNNKMCIVFIEKDELFIEKQEKYIICIDGTKKGYETLDKKNKYDIDIEKYINECCYFSTTESGNIGNVSLRHIEVKGLKKQSEKYFKKTWIYYNKKYEVLAHEEKDCYKYEVKVSQNTGEITISCIWDNYENFNNRQEPKNVILKINKESIITGSYKQISSLAPSYGLSIDYSVVREYLKNREKLDLIDRKKLDLIIPKILYDYFENEKYLKQKQEIIEQHINNEQKPEIYYNEEAIEGTNYISKRHAIVKRMYRP